MSNQVVPAQAADPLVVALRTLTRTTRILERSFEELTPAQYRVLSAVDGGDDRATRVAARLALGKPALSTVVDALATRGLLDRGPDPDDQRAVRLTVTEAGARALAGAEESMGRRLRELAPGPEELAALVDLLGLWSASVESDMAARFRDGRRR